MTAENKINEKMKDLGYLRDEFVIQLVIETYKLHYDEDFSSTLGYDKKEKLWILEDIYNERKFQGASLREAYEALYLEMLEEIFYKELQEEREREEAEYRKDIDICIARERYARY